MADSQMSLKDKNRLPLLGVLIVNIFVFYSVLNWEELSSLNWEELLSHDLLSALLNNLTSFLPFGGALIFTTLLNGILPSELKAKLVFWRWTNPLPCRAAFSDYAQKDQRIDFSVIEQRFFPLPTTAIIVVYSVNPSMNKLLDKAIFIIAISLIFGSFIFKPQETTTDKKLEINNIDISNNNPSQADSKNLNNLLLNKDEYILSYNCSKGIANWVGWRTSEDDLGELSRSNDFREDESLPKKCYQVDEKDYRNSGYDRGHLMPSGDRTKSKSANSSSFLMINMIPQHPDNNRQIWRALEIYSRELVNQGFTLHSFAGGNGQLKTINKGKISVPRNVWKVILVENKRSGKVKAIAVIMPNSEKVRKTDWTDYLVTVDKVESVTGYDFFAYLSDDVEEKIESQFYHNR